MLMVHGRGATAASILTLSAEFDHEGLAFLAPQAAGGVWYPNSFLAPIASNEPWLSSALSVLADVCRDIEAHGPGVRRTVLLGFSQGTCLSVEFAARNPARYGAIIGFSGGLIGPEGTPREYPGSFDGTPVFLGSSDPDPHVPTQRVRETAEVLSAMGAVVTTRIYPRLGHTVNRDEMDAANNLVTAMLTDS